MINENGLSLLRRIQHRQLLVQPLSRVYPLLEGVWVRRPPTLAGTEEAPPAMANGEAMGRADYLLNSSS